MRWPFAIAAILIALLIVAAIGMWLYLLLTGEVKLSELLPTNLPWWSSLVAVYIVAGSYFSYQLELRLASEASARTNSKMPTIVPWWLIAGLCLLFAAYAIGKVPTWWMWLLLLGASPMYVIRAHKSRYAAIGRSADEQQVGHALESHGVTDIPERSLPLKLATRFGSVGLAGAVVWMYFHPNIDTAIRGLLLIALLASFGAIVGLAINAVRNTASTARRASGFAKQAVVNASKAAKQVSETAGRSDLERRLDTIEELFRAGKISAEERTFARKRALDQ